MRHPCRYTMWNQCWFNAELVDMMFNQPYINFACPLGYLQAIGWCRWSSELFHGNVQHKLIMYYMYMKCLSKLGSWTRRLGNIQMLSYLKIPDCIYSYMLQSLVVINVFVCLRALPWVMAHPIFIYTSVKKNTYFNISYKDLTWASNLRLIQTNIPSALRRDNEVLSQ